MRLPYASHTLGLFSEEYASCASICPFTCKGRPVNGPAGRINLKLTVRGYGSDGIVYVDLMIATRAAMTYINIEIRDISAPKIYMAGKVTI